MRALHNLKHISVSIPINALNVVTGVSGSGKSSLAFDTIYAEGQRRYVESAENILSLNHLPLGARLLVRSKKDWRTAVVSKLTKRRSL